MLCACYQYGLSLFDFFFTKEELGSSLVYKSKKSTKPGVERAKVEKLFRKYYRICIVLAILCLGLLYIII